ncbi:MAG TPA: cytochrome c biogenesis protein ResB [Mycobacteriales bacterium]|nr:cytochrome c biogenesis protein ResB [Mycobacteriales bacterium]
MTEVRTDPAAVDDGAGSALSTAPEPPPSARGRSPRSTVRLWWRQLTSMRTAILLLFLLALAAVPGSLLPQRGLNADKVARFFAAHPHLAPLLDRLSLFDVFGAWWFAAIYLLLFVSLIGCLVPRIRLHARALAARPPAAPRRLSRLRSHASWTVPGDPTAAVDAARRLLRKRRFRVDVRAEPDGVVSLGAEKGYLRETGNLLFHLALLGLLAGIGLGGVFGYKGTVNIVQGGGFSNTLIGYDTFHPGRVFSDRELAPFALTLTGFRAIYTASGEAVSFDAPVRYTAAPGEAARSYDIRVNHPLDIGGTKVYLLGHGYAPRFEVWDAHGNLVYDQATIFPPIEVTNFASTGVIKVPDAVPQLGFTGFFFPTAGLSASGLPLSLYPAARHPVVALTAYRGDLGLTGGAPQNVFELDTTHLKKIGIGVLVPGQSMRLPGGGRIEFVDVEQFGAFQVTHDPGRTLALIAALTMVAGLVLSLRVRRRRVWLRASPAGAGSPDGRTVVDVAGLARTDHDDFADEFAELVGLLDPGRGSAGRPDLDEE